MGFLGKPSRPAEAGADAGGRLRYFVFASVLAHGLLFLLITEKNKPFSTVDRNRPALLVEFKQGLPPTGRAAASAAGRTQTQIPGKVAPSSAASSAPAVPTARHEAPDAVPARDTARPLAIDASELLATSKAEIATASRRQMLDPMFAHSARHHGRPSPLERATAQSGEMVERLGDDLVRITTSSGQRYCLQRLPEFATRDSPLPMMAVPMNCP